MKLDKEHIYWQFCLLDFAKKYVLNHIRFLYQNIDQRLHKTISKWRKIGLDVYLFTFLYQLLSMLHLSWWSWAISWAPNKSLGRLKSSFANNRPYLSAGIRIQWSGLSKSTRSFTQGSFSTSDIYECGKILLGPFQNKM